MLVLLIRWLAILSILFCVALAFRYPHEERSLQSRLEDWWVRLVYTGERHQNWLEAFVASLARSATGLFDRTLGAEQFSERLLTIAFLLGISLEGLVQALQLWAAPPASIREGVFEADSRIGQLVIVGCWTAWYSTLLPLYVRVGRSKGGIRLLARLTLLHYSSTWLVATVASSDLASLAGTAFAWASALILHFEIRTLIRHAAELGTPRGRTTYLRGSVFLCAAAFAIIFGLLASWSATHSPLLMRLVETIRLAIIFNAINIVMVAGIMVTSLGLLGYQFGWPLLSRILYQIPERRVISDRKALGTISLALLPIAWFGPPIPTKDTGNCNWTATLSGTASPNGAWTAAWFEWGDTPALKNVTSARLFSGKTRAGSYDEVVTLAEGTTYFYRAVVVNAYGRAEGEVLQFETQRCLTDPQASGAS